MLNPLNYSRLTIWGLPGNSAIVGQGVRRLTCQGRWRRLLLLTHAPDIIAQIGGCCLRFYAYLSLGSRRARVINTVAPAMLRPTEWVEGKVPEALADLTGWSQGRCSICRSWEFVPGLASRYPMPLSVKIYRGIWGSGSSFFLRPGHVGPDVVPFVAVFGAPCLLE